MKPQTLSTLLLATLSLHPACAALISNGDIESAVSTHSNANGDPQWRLDTTTNIVQISIKTAGVFGPFTDTTFNAGEWLDTSLARTFVRSDTGGNGGTAGFIQQGTNGNSKPRGLLFFSDDAQATTGSITATIDLKLDQASQSFTVELYGWNDAQTAPALTVGGTTADEPNSWNASTLGGATAVYDIDVVDTTTVGAWETVSLGTADLGTGYDNYAWRIGVVGSASGGTYAFDNLVVTAVPEPSSLGLLGLAGASILFRRRRTH